MAGVDQGNGARLRHGAQVGFQAEINHWPGGDFDAKISQGTAHRAQALDGGFLRRCGHMDEPFRGMGEHNPLERVFMGGEVGKAVVGGGGHRHRPLLAATLQVEDDGFLQHLVPLERLIAGREQVHLADGRPRQDKVPERPVVWPVAEAAGDDGHDLPTRCGLRHSQGHKSGIEIHRLDADAAQGQPVG